MKVSELRLGDVKYFPSVWAVICEGPRQWEYQFVTVLVFIEYKDKSISSSHASSCSPGVTFALCPGTHPLTQEALSPRDCRAICCAMSSGFEGLPNNVTR